MRWRWMVAAGALMVAGCSPQAPPSAPAAPGPAAKAAGKTLTFAMIPKQLDNPVFAYARQAAEKRAAELGVKLLWDGPAW